jgi:hypothetical protein
VEITEKTAGARVATGRNRFLAGREAKRRMLEVMDGKPGENHSGELRLARAWPEAQSPARLNVILSARWN